MCFSKHLSILKLFLFEFWKNNLQNDFNPNVTDLKEENKRKEVQHLSQKKKKLNK